MSKPTKTYHRADEPLYWGLFGAGGVVAAFALPALILITGLLVPLGVLELDYASVKAFADNWLGKLIILVLISLPMWHACHRIYHAMHDFKLDMARGFFKLFWYGFAFVCSVGAAFYLVAI